MKVLEENTGQNLVMLDLKYDTKDSGHKRKNGQETNWTS
jgi:hypothetical protein